MNVETQGQQDKHKWGDIRMTGHKMDVVIAMIMATHSNPGSRQFNLPESVIERDFQPTVTREYVQNPVI
jgi:hypothetical protein